MISVLVKILETGLYFVFEMVIGLLDLLLFAENCRSVILFFSADSVVGMNLLPLGLDWGHKFIKDFPESAF